MAAFPFASEDAFRLGPIGLNPNMNGGTGELWRAAERTLLATFPASSIDGLICLRDRCWFGTSRDESTSLSSYLQRLAASVLEVRGGIARPRLAPPIHFRSDGDDVEDRRAWRWMSFALPPDLLLSGLDRKAAKVEILSPRVERALQDQGFAESHLHVTLALDFPTIWVAATRSLAAPGMGEGALGGPAASMQEGHELGGWLLRAALARYVLAVFLKYGESKTFSDFLASTFRVELEANMSWAKSTIHFALDELASGMRRSDGPSFEDIQAAYRTLIPEQSAPKRLVEIPAWDPIARHCQPHGEFPEDAFLDASLSYIRSHTDTAFTRLFWQVVRCRCIFYRHLVQRPMTAGLQWFVRFCKRQDPVTDIFEKGIFVESAIKVSGEARGLRALELRSNPNPDQTKMLGYLRTLAHRSQEFCDRGGREVGLVFHFSRERYHESGGPWRSRSDKPFANGAGTYIDPAANLRQIRFGDFYPLLRKRASTLSWILEQFPQALQLVRGLDACTDEVAVPVWVISPLFVELRRVSEVASARLGGRIAPFRITAHAGEDFLHLQGGLRRIDETITFLRLREGDRLGHCIALGLDPVHWANRCGPLLMPREERLLDLIWERTWYRNRGINVDSGRLTYIEGQIERLSDAIFGGHPPSIHELTTLVRCLHSQEERRRAGFYGETRWREGQNPLLERYLSDRNVFARGRETEWIDPSIDCDALSRLQEELRRKVARSGLTIEINPSSNLLIGNLGDLSQHPLWRLKPPRDDVGTPPLPLCLGSDDPSIFATSLPEEFQLVYDSLLLAGLSEVEAQRWLDEVRNCGLGSRFTVTRENKLNLDDIISCPPLTPDDYANFP